MATAERRRVLPKRSPRWVSDVNAASEEFQKRYKEMCGLVEEMNGRMKESTSQGPESHQKRHLKNGQLLARDRVELLLDQDAPFLELMPLAGWGQENMSLGGSVVGGIGIVSGVECLISATVSTIKGGASNKVSVLKGLRLAEIALENRLPSISLIQSGGADLRQQAKVFHRGGATFRDLAIRSKLGIPTVCVVFGSSTAGGAYNPGMSDYVIMVKKQARVFLGGPPLVKMATGEEVDDETLGGAEMHATKSGVCDFLASDEYDAIQKARFVIANLHWTKRTLLPAAHFLSQFEDPYYNPDEILGIASANIREPFPVREIIARIVDGSRFWDFKPLYGPTLVCAFAEIHGIPVAIIANNDGVIFSDSSCKATQFIDLCNQRHIPILFLQNVTGFMVGQKYEEGGIIKHGSKFINAVSNSGVPHITIVMGSSYGAGNYAMCGRAYRPRFIFSWPSARCSVMGPEQLTGVMDTVARAAAARSGKAIDEEQAAAQKSMYQALVEQQSDVYFTSSRLLDDGIIDPRDTRTVVGMCLSIIHGETIQGANHPGVSRL